MALQVGNMVLKQIDIIADEEKLSNIRSLMEIIRDYWAICLVLLAISAVLWATPRYEKYLQGSKLNRIARDVDEIKKLMGPTSGKTILRQIGREDKVARYIDAKLERLCEFNRARRAQWWRLHDGQEDTVSGVHFYFFSLANEHVAVGVSHLLGDRDFERIPVSNLPMVTESLGNKISANIIVSDLEPSSWARRLFGRHGVVQVVSVPVFASDGAPMGAAMLLYENEVDPFMPVKMLRNFAAEMKGVLLR